MLGAEEGWLFYYLLLLNKVKYSVNYHNISILILKFGFKDLYNFLHFCAPMLIAQNEQRSNILRLKRRFLKDQEKTSLIYAQKENQRQRQKKVSDGELNMLICVCFLKYLMFSNMNQF